MNKSVKLTKEEMARRIIAEGIYNAENSYGRYEIYDSFGQRWCITRHPSGNVKKIEQIDKSGKVIYL